MAGKRLKRKVGLDLYIFTPGVWQEVPGSSKLCGVGLEIESLIDDMVNCNIECRTISIRFIRFGNDPVGHERLTALVEKVRNKYNRTEQWYVLPVLSLQNAY
jgi:hypothetical protein